MKAVILDGYTVNPGDLSWQELKEICDVVIYDRTSKEQILERIGNAEIIITNKTPITKDVLLKAPNIRYIGVLATGYNVVDLETARSFNIPVTNVPNYSTMAVAQLVFAFILEICHHVGSHSDEVKQGKWSQSHDFCFWSHPLIELSGKTLGIIGFGAIGKKVSSIAMIFGMNVLVYSRTVKKEYENEKLKFVSLDELYKSSDIITLHVPLSDNTKGMINKHSIEKMKDDVILINTSRGPLIVEEDLYNALENNKIYAAGIDVTSIEPIPSDSCLLKAKNIFITPHIAWAPIETRKRLMNIAVSNIKAFLANQYENVVNGVK